MNGIELTGNTFAGSENEYQDFTSISVEGPTETGMGGIKRCLFLTEGNSATARIGVVALLGIGSFWTSVGNSLELETECPDQTSIRSGPAPSNQVQLLVDGGYRSAFSYPVETRRQLDAVSLMDDLPTMPSLGKFVGKLKPSKKLELHPDLFD